MEFKTKEKPPETSLSINVRSITHIGPYCVEQKGKYEFTGSFKVYYGNFGKYQTIRYEGENERVVLNKIVLEQKRISDMIRSYYRKKLNLNPSHQIAYFWSGIVIFKIIEVTRISKEEDEKGKPYYTFKIVIETGEEFPECYCSFKGAKNVKQRLLSKLRKISSFCEFS